MPVSAAQSQPPAVTVASSQTAATTSMTTGANCTTSTTPAATRTPQVQESFQSLDNIDLAIFGSTVVLADHSTAVSTARVGPAGATSEDPPNSRSGGVVLDAAALFTGSRAPITRLATPRFRSRTNRGNFFDPMRLLRVDEETAKRERSAVFTQL